MTPSIIQVETTNLRYLLNLIKNEVKRELNCHAIGSITSFDPLTATANVSFNYKKVLKKRNTVSPSPNSFSDIVIDYPVLLRVPVIILNGGGAYTTYPIAAGDNCLIMFCDRDIDLWLEKGSKQNAPNTERMHDISDAVALVGLYPVTQPISDYSITAIKTVYGRVTMTLTNLVASIIDRHGERLIPPGTGPISTFARTPPSGWLFMYGQTLGKASSGAIESSDDYGDLFDVLKFVTPNSSGAVFSAGDKIIIPDCRGRASVYKNDMGGNNSSVLTPTYTPNRSLLGGAIGEESHQLIIPELPAHNHSKDSYRGGYNGGGDWMWAWNAGNGYTGKQITDDTGSNVPHNTVQPGIIVNAMIKY